MKTKTELENRRYLLLLKLDAQSLFNRIKNRKKEYIEIFAMKRTRAHFKEIFWNRYEDLGIEGLAHCSEDTIMALDRYYNAVDDIRWYLNHTEDMPKTVDNELDYMVMHLEEFYQTANLFIDGELGIEHEEEMDDFSSKEEAEEELGGWDTEQQGSDDFGSDNEGFELDEQESQEES